MEFVKNIYMMRLVVEEYDFFLSVVLFHSLDRDRKVPASGGQRQRRKMRTTCSVLGLLSLIIIQASSLCTVQAEFPVMTLI